MTITSPTGRQYQWSSDTPPTQADYDALAKYDAEQAGVKYDPAAGKTPPPAEEPIMFGNDIRSLGSQQFRDRITNSGNRPFGMMTDVGLEAGGATAGQAVGTALAPATFGASIPVGGFIGGAGGNALGQYRRMKAGEADKFSLGQMLGAGVAGAIPGASQAKAGLGMGAKLALESGKMAAGNVAAKAVETGVDEGRLPTVGEAGLAGGAAVVGTVGAKALDTGSRSAAALVKKIQNSVRDQTLAEARVLGYVIPPSKVNPSATNKLLESLAGKADTMQEAAARNQEITTSLAKKTLGVQGDAPLTEELLRQVRTESAKPYAEIAAFSEKAKADLIALQRAKLNVSDPHELNVLMSDPAIVKEMNPLVTKASADIEALKQARADATAGFKFARTNPDPAVLKAARASSELADKLEQQIEDAASEIGRPGLVDELRAARTRIAKSYEIERALNLGDASVSAPVLGRSLDKGAPLTGELKTIAKMQQAFPQAMREGASTPTSGVSKLKALTALGGTMVGYQAAGPYGAAAGLVPLADSQVRKLLLSKGYQRFGGSPMYPGAGQQDTLASYIRLGSQAAGRKKWWEQ